MVKFSPNKSFVIAEIGINHMGSLSKAKKLIDSAVRAGAHAVKFQTYKTEKRVNFSKDNNIFKILKKCELSNQDFIKLKKYSDNKKIIFFSTPFDISSAFFLNEIGVKIFKIASFDVGNTKFLKEIAKFKKIFILSTGMASEKEIKKAVSIFKNNKRKLILLHCISSYPNKEENSNLACIDSLKKFNVPVGLSDHTNDIFVPTIAKAMGINVIEKHFMISKFDKCIDNPVSITEEQMSKLVKNLKRIDNVMGDSKLKLRNCEKNSIIFKRKS
jgi:N,N'-diacetyllegionaminate synthase